MGKERFLSFKVFEGVKRDGEDYKMDFSGDSEGDIMSLKFSNKSRRKMKSGETEYEYYYAYEFDNKTDKEFLEALKKLDDRITPDDAKLLVNKAVIGFDHEFDTASYDAIVYPKSSSIVLKEVAQQLFKKSGNSLVFPDSFVKAARSDIKFDQEKIDKLPDATKKEVERVIEKIQTEEGPFKIRTVFSRLRKFVKDFIIFNSENDRKLMNAVVGKKVILVDDYRTSGTTLKEMMKQLIALSPEKITVFILVNVK